MTSADWANKDFYKVLGVAKDASAAGGTTGTGDSDEDVVDAEIVDEDTDGAGEGERK